MKSAFYTGTVRHRRFTPLSNQFEYRLFMVFADLDELPTIFERHPLWSLERPNVVSYRRQDYLGAPEKPLDTAVRDLVRRKTGRRPQGPIRLLSHFRTWGYCFNPVSFYYCYDAGDRQVETVVAHINNTPWGERHAYVLSQASVQRPNSQWRQFRLKKGFHISPFMDMDMDYDWRFRMPGRRTGAHMRLLQDGRCIFDASLNLQRQPLTRRNMTRMLVHYPMMTHKVTLMIYWQALRLWHKKAPFYTHPAKRTST